MLALPVQFEALAGKFHERHGRWLTPAVTALLTVLLGWALARLLWSLVPLPESAQWKPAPVVASNSGPRNAGGPNVQAIVDAHLFGVYTAPANPSAAALNNAPDTSLNLNLLGILAGSNEDDSRAIIGQQSGEEMPYAIGQDIVAGVSLQAIFPDRVILLRNGSPETLRLDKDAPSSATAPVVAENTPGTGGQQIGQIREQIMNDPSKAAEFIRVQPATAAGGGTKGYRIYPGKDRALFTASGLRPGDLVTAVNGIQLDDGQKALQTLNDLKGAGSVTLTLERGGQQQTVNVSFQP